MVIGAIKSLTSCDPCPSLNKERIRGAFEDELVKRPVVVGEDLEDLNLKEGHTAANLLWDEDSGQERKQKAVTLSTLHLQIGST